ncbi:exopolysaccharide biosynthesis polyprenyl glycosylphosphotransferase [Salinimicrobium catena]|uniref:exopolysaccharide biosynthesis polyprenyl glycosylphosphotransferase n=1 Tax=Salinimicrobium catena TaxID=390640 RepID=UPI002FE45DE9
MKNSTFIIPISVLIHLSIINLTLYIWTPATYLHLPSILFFNLAWLIISLSLNFYPTERKEKFFTNLHKALQQYIVFGLSYFAFLGYNKVFYYSTEYHLTILTVIFIMLILYRWFFFYARSRYRMEGGNSVNVVILGKDKNLEKLEEIFHQPEFGYRYKGFFDKKESLSSSYLGAIQDSWDFILTNNIEEVYCAASVFSKKEIKQLIDFTDNNLKKLKIIPDNKEIFTPAMTVELYENLPVINIRKIPLENRYAQILKRSFDLIFSTLIILGVLSWLTPLLFVIIKLESPGPIFFKQKRPGVNKTSFWCYKFRSMATNNLSDEPSKKNDARVTKIGKILRKTSIDELPQFFNVFLGDMSVVGPRPHMQWQNELYQTSVDKFLVRQLAKPGITGLAQVKGFRGEIIEKSDIVNRVRMDIFYLEKWSPILDLKIIYSTVANVIKGEEKAY